MAKWKLIYDGEEIDDFFDTEEDAQEHANYLDSCSRLGAEILHMSNPCDYDYDEEFDYSNDYEIVEVDED